RFHGADPHPGLPSSPPRRSSDLQGAAKWNVAQRIPDLVLERRAAGRRRQVEGLQFTGEISAKLRNRLVEQGVVLTPVTALDGGQDRKSTRLNSSHVKSSYAVSCS